MWAQFVWLEEGQEQTITPIGGRGWTIQIQCSCPVTLLVLFIFHVSVSSHAFGLSHSFASTDRLCEWVTSSGKFTPGPTNDSILQVMTGIRLPSLPPKRIARP
jgi:hypothetical protein